MSFLSSEMMDGFYFLYYIYFFVILYFMNQKHVWAKELSPKKNSAGQAAPVGIPPQPAIQALRNRAGRGAVPTFASQSIHHTVPPSHPKLMSLASQRGGHFEMILKIVYGGKIHIT